MFTTDMRAIRSSAPVDPDGLVSQHLPMLTRVDIEYCGRQEIFQGLKRVNLMHSPGNRANRIEAVCRHIEENDLGNWDNVEEFLTFVGVQTVKVCTLSKGVRKVRDGWSPVTKGLTMNLRAIVTMLRHVHGYQAHKNLQWCKDNFKPGLHALLRKWRQHGRKIAHTGELADAYLNLSRFGEQFWLNASWDTLIGSLAEAYRVVKSMLHGADRSRRRTALNERVAKIEVCVKRAKPGQQLGTRWAQRIGALTSRR